GVWVERRSVSGGRPGAGAGAGPRREAVFAADGAVTARSVAVVGLAYDHRFVNGSTAVEFLKAIKVALESPTMLGAPSVSGGAVPAVVGPSSAGVRGEEASAHAGHR